jgi:tetratricopeptide (TPR) repeat protein
MILLFGGKMMQRTSLLGVHLVVRDEQHFLPQCLNSIHALADEIIVIDTGSTDRTIEIARSFGAKVFSVEWEDDFAKARNEALRHAATEWVLYLDADEILSGTELIKERLQAADAEAFWVNIENVTGELPADRLFHRAVRLFRNRAEYVFEGRIHEQVVPSILKQHPISKIETSDLKIVHYGYLPEPMQQKQKLERNLRMLRQAVAEAPDDPFQLYNLGIVHYQLGELEQAAKLFDRARGTVHIHASFRPALIVASCQTFIDLNRYDEARAMLKSEIEGHYDDYPDLLHLLGVACERLGLLQDAFYAYQRALMCDKVPGKYVTSAGMGTSLSKHALARLARDMNLNNEASLLYRSLLSEFPHYEPAWNEWADFLFQSGQSDGDIATHLRDTIPPSTDNEWLLAARALSHIGAFSEALDVVNSMTEPSLEARRLICECLLQLGRLPEASSCLEALFAQADEGIFRTLLLDYALCCWGQTRKLPGLFFALLTKEQRQVYTYLDVMLVSESCRPAPPPDELLQQAIPDLLERSIQLGQPETANRLAGLCPDLPLKLAKLLFREGYILLAADILIQLAAKQQLDTEGFATLAEIVYDKGHFSQAAEMFEQILAVEPQHNTARIGAALCYLQLGRAVAQDSLMLAPGHGAWQSDLHKLDHAIGLLNRMSWRTSWSAAQRRRFHVQAVHFPMHDR